MLRVSRRACSRSFLSSHFTGEIAVSQGFSLVEALVASVILAVAVVATMGAFNFVVSSIRGTGTTAARNAVIDNDISEIKRLSQLYSACTSAQGSIPSGEVCPSAGGEASYPAGNSYYYFPSSDANIDAFFAACNSTSEGSHIVANFISAIGSISLPSGSGVQRSAVREDGSDADNHVVKITYTSTADLNFSRVVKVVPVLSSWCN